MRVTGDSPSERKSTLRGHSPSERKSTLRSHSPSERRSTLRGDPPSERKSTLRGHSLSKKKSTPRGDSQSKKKITWMGGGVEKYDKDSIIYENYYDYGEEYYRIVKKKTESTVSTKSTVRSHKKDINKTLLFKENNERRSMWDLLIECIEEILEEMNIHQGNLSLEEWKILMVMLQSRYGYGSDLRETSIAMCRLPFSTYMDIDVCPEYGTDEYISKNLKYYNKIKKCEQMPHVSRFKDITSADQIVLDGWKWLINFLSEDVQNRILLNTVAEVVHIKEEHTFWGSNSKFVHHAAHQQGDHLFINTPGEFPPRGGPQAGTYMSNSPHCVRHSTGNYPYGDVFYKGATHDGKGIHFAHKAQHTGGFKRGHETISGGEARQGFGVLRNRCQPGEKQENYNVMVQCKSYDTSKKQINKNFHGTSDLTNCNYTNVNIFAKYVIVALPLGCLTNNDKKEKKKSYLQFEPKLHPLKMKALNNYRMGNHNKIILRFYPFDFAWPFDSLQLNCIDQKFQFLNLHAYGKIGCILVHCFPPWSCTYGYINKEHYIVNECLCTLHKMFENTGKKLPILVDYLITKWQDDNFSFGSYAYPYVNCTDNDLIYLRAPHPIDNPKVVFCGEYLSKSYFQCVDGAYDTGIRAAEDIAHIGLKLASRDTKWYNTDVFFFPQDTCPFTNIPLPKLTNNLLGFYITDGSDEALSDYESSSQDEDLANISNIPLSLLKGEHDFLSYSLNNVLQFFDHLKGDAICKSDDGKQTRGREREKQSSVEGGDITAGQPHTGMLKYKMDSSPLDEDFAEDLARKWLASGSSDLPLNWLALGTSGLPLDWLSLMCYTHTEGANTAHF
ncbi:lysine-specific histone demethylase 1 [Plasmodium cynomolgi strain B]|uniref:Lysine-specific histone demethylase 1 n=1 Tax=Plasmodium cynomolgi (strain B) TaxID=1120755 RepID=K6UM63_PLACD|nr:lysine-specific histone demethylase 1 [Plasmodium cynomolgi strain B]GAB68328.1 lysine-specific histone demethylase 1 [Plasmodium cynomolgi strain B]